MRYSWLLEGAEHQVSPDVWRADGARLAIDDGLVEARVQQLESGCHALWLNGQRHELRVVHQGDAAWMHFRGRSFVLQVRDQLALATTADASRKGEVRAPMPGVVVAVDVEPGQEVEEGKRLLSIESMKLLSELHAPCRGVVTAVHVGVGDGFDKDCVLVELAAEDPAEGAA